MVTIQDVERRVRGATVSCVITIPIVLLLLFLMRLINLEHLLFGLEISWLTSCVLFLIYYIPETVAKFRKKEV